MFLIDHAPQVASQARIIRTHALTGAALIYEFALRPVPQDLAIYMAMARLIRGFKDRTPTERRLMDEYTTSRLFGDGTWPQGMDWALVSFTEAQLFAQRVDYHKKHPIRSRLQAAA